MASQLTPADIAFLAIMDKQGNACKFTGLPFEDRGDLFPNGDHCHTTNMFRGYVHAIVNRFLGTAEAIMDYTGWTHQQLAERLNSYLDAPGDDLGLEPYPTNLGYATEEEAIAAYERNLKEAA